MRACSACTRTTARDSDGEAATSSLYTAVEASGFDETFTDGKYERHHHVEATCRRRSSRGGAGQRSQRGGNFSKRGTLHQGRSDLPRCRKMKSRTETSSAAWASSTSTYYMEAHAPASTDAKTSRASRRCVPGDDHEKSEIALHAQEADGRRRQYAKIRWLHRAVRERLVWSYEVADDVTGGSIPREFIPACRQGLQGRRRQGFLDRFPVCGHSLRHQRRRAAHAVDSPKWRSNRRLDGFPGAASGAQPTILEPI